MTITGSVSILNTAGGDDEIAINGEDDEAQIKRALEVLETMRQRGYALLVEMPDGTYRRAKSIDVKNRAYVVDDLRDSAQVPAIEEPSTEATPTRARGRPKKQSVETRHPIATSKSVAVARSAGG